MLRASLIVDGLVERKLELQMEDFQRIDTSHQVADVSHYGAKRPGSAVRFAAILQLANPSSAATHLGLHSEVDDFHASIPISPVRERALLIYAVNGQPMSREQGGPFRFFIPDHAACHVDEIDECANVKFLDRIELTQGKGYDNRPQDDEEHARLHEE